MITLLAGRRLRTWTGITPWSQRVCLATAMALVSLSGSVAQAAVFFWQDNNSSNWFDSANWSSRGGGGPGPPGNGDTANINLDDGIILTGSTAPIDGLTLSNDAGIRTNGHMLVVSNPGATAMTRIIETGGPAFNTHIRVSPGGSVRSRF